MSLSRRGWLASTLPLLAQNPAKDPPHDPPTPTFSVDVNVVTVNFLVRDQNGRLVPSLERADFEVFESGQKQEIVTFAKEQKTPLTLGLIIDRSGSQDQFEQENTYAAVIFFRSVLRDQDRALLSAFAGRVKLIHDLTGSLDNLETALRGMRDNYQRAPHLGPADRDRSGSAVLDSIYWTAREKFRSLPGRKALIMIGDGKDNASRMQMVDVIDLLQTEDILFYGLDNGGNDDKEKRNRMLMIADESGGRVIDTNKTQLRRAFDEIEQELRTLYTLTYRSSNPARDGRYRRIDIRPRNSALQVRARPGYYAR